MSTKICDTCIWFTPVHELLIDGKADGICGISGEEVEIYDSCECHKTEAWFDEDSV